MIRLYSIPPSLYSAKTRIVLRAKGLAWEDVPPPGGYASDVYKQIVPSGTLPAIDHDGFLLADSEAINEYLNELVPEPALWPEGLQARAQARFLSRFHDTRLEPSVRTLFAHVDPARRDPVVVETQTLLIAERLAQLARISSPSPLMTGEQLSLADCGYAITLCVLDLLNSGMNLGITLPPSLLDYSKALRTEPNVAAELAQYKPAMALWLESELGSLP